MMSSTNDEDPFLQVQQDVLTALTQTRPLFSSYLRIRSLNPTSSSPELVSARSDLESALSSLAEDLSDLVDSVSAIESNPSQFVGITAHEIKRRKRLVQEVGGEIEDMREELRKQTGAGTSRQAGGRKGHGSGGQDDGSDLPDPSSFVIPDGEGEDGEGGAGDNYAEFEQQQQVAIMREQDEHLDGVFQTVGNLRSMANDMGRELEEQREALEVVDELADRVGGRLQTGVEKLGKIVRANEERWSGCCIMVLIVVLIILLVLLLVL